MQESVHPKSLDFANQGKVVIQRGAHEPSFPEIAKDEKRNLAAVGGPRLSRAAARRYACDRRGVESVGR